MSKSAKLKELVGPLPVAIVNATLDTELEAGEVVFSIPPHRHAMQHHPDDFARCLPHIGGVVTAPLYVGDDFRNPGKIELISRLQS